MFLFDSPESKPNENSWSRKLDKFVKANQNELAALAWGLFLERGEESEEILAIDIAETARFVYCKKEAVEELNRQVRSHIQEVVGVLNAHKPEKEVAILAIGEGQIKLILFEPKPEPPVCFEEAATDVDTLLAKLEQQMAEYMKG
ncbi:MULTISPECIES: beta-carboxysome assembly chaperone CcmS [unclassified Microcoleus]|uniref:beta-carboxysome assembly chaperone CcmS n=1 Tax=unclassified Microcoleus TaxID=2642155 RepID=UPI002FD03526